MFENNAKRKPRRWLWQIDTNDGKQNEGRGSKLNTPQSDRGPVLCFKPEVGGQPGGKPWMAEWCELLRLLWCCLDLCHMWIRVKSHPLLRAVSSHLVLHSLMCFARLLSFLNQCSHFSNLNQNTRASQIVTICWMRCKNKRQNHDNIAKRCKTDETKKKFKRTKNIDTKTGHKCWPQSLNAFFGGKRGQTRKSRLHRSTGRQDWTSALQAEMRRLSRRYERFSVVLVWCEQQCRWRTWRRSTVSIFFLF